MDFIPAITTKIPVYQVPVIPTYISKVPVSKAPYIPQYNTYSPNMSGVRQRHLNRVNTHDIRREIEDLRWRANAEDEEGSSGGGGTGEGQVGPFSFYSVENFNELPTPPGGEGPAFGYSANEDAYYVWQNGHWVEIITADNFQDYLEQYIEDYLPSLACTATMHQTGSSPNNVSSCGAKEPSHFISTTEGNYGRLYWVDKNGTARCISEAT